MFTALLLQINSSHGLILPLFVITLIHPTYVTIYATLTIQTFIDFRISQVSLHFYMQKQKHISCGDWNIQYGLA